MPVQTPLLAVIPAFLLAAAVLAAGWRPWSKVEDRRWDWCGALAVALAFLCADYFVWKSWPGLWAAEEHRRLPWVAWAAVIIAVVDRALLGRIRRTPLSWLAGAALALPIVWVDVSRPGTYPISLIWWAMWSGAIAIIWSESAATAHRAKGVRVPLVLCIAGAGAAITIIQSYTVSIGLTAAGLSAAMGAFVALAIWRPQLPAAAMATPVYAALLVGLLVSSRQTGLYSTILVLLSAGTAGLGDRGPLRSLKPWLATLICALLTLALAIAAIKLSPKGFDFSES
jgi:hypothetical protein